MLETQTKRQTKVREQRDKAFENNHNVNKINYNKTNQNVINIKNELNGNYILRR
jgi:hypothetical protein